MNPDSDRLDQARHDLLRIALAGVRSVAGDAAVRRWLQTNRPTETVAAVAIGKAAMPMLEGVRSVLGDDLAETLAITSAGYVPATTTGIPWIEGSHPVPDSRSLAAGEALLTFVEGLPPGRQLLVCLSGGASSMVEVLRPGVTLEDLAAANRWLLGSGLAIHEMNAVRKSLSLIKGGGLLSFLGSRSVTGLLISDVPSDDPAVIGSGLLTPAPTLPGIMSRLPLPSWLGELTRSVTAAPAVYPSVAQVLVATNHDALQAASVEARRLGYQAYVHTRLVEGDAAGAGTELAESLLHASAGIHLWGGETTVTLPTHPGRGGRNQHLALSAARLLAGRDEAALLSLGTDGRDGPGEDAGALVDGGTLERMQIEGFDPDTALSGADSGRALEASGDLVHTGPTGTNVMDLVIGWKGG